MKPPRLHVGLVLFQAALAATIVLLDFLEACGACRRGTDLHLWIAAVVDALRARRRS